MQYIRSVSTTLHPRPLQIKMLCTSKNSGSLHMPVIIGLLLVTCLIGQVNGVSSCFNCEMVGTQGLSCENAPKMECPPQASASCLKSTAQQKDPAGKWIPVQLKRCESGKGPTSTNPEKSHEVCEDYEEGETRGRRCFCLTDNCNDGHLPELKPELRTNNNQSSSGAPHFTGSPKTMSHVTFSLGSALLLYLIAIII